MGDEEHGDSQNGSLQRRLTRRLGGWLDRHQPPAQKGLVPVLGQIFLLFFGGDPIELLVELKIHNVTPRFIREAREKAGEDLSLEEILEMRIASYRTLRTTRMIKFYSDED